MATFDIFHASNDQMGDDWRVSAPQNFDLLAYAERYHGTNRAQRLMFISKHCPDLSLQSRKLAAEVLRKGQNTPLYVQVVGSSELSADDSVWLSDTNSRLSQKQKHLENELLKGKSLMLKESIAMSFIDLGVFYYEKGQLLESLKNFGKARENCATSKQGIEVCTAMLSVALENGDISSAQGLIATLDLQPAELEPSTRSRKYFAQGLCAMSEKMYKQAARLFAQVEKEFSSPTDTALSTAKYVNLNNIPFPYTMEDAAVMGTLCALASMDRAGVKDFILQSSAVKKYASAEMRQLATKYTECQYGECLKILAVLRDSLMLDPALSPHVNALLTFFVDKAMLEYCSPYNTVSLQRMSTVFAMSSHALETSLSQLIVNGKLAARIDSEAQVLKRKELNARAAAVDAILSNASAQSRDLARGVMRLSLARSGLCAESGIVRHGHGHGRTGSLLFPPAADIIASRGLHAEFDIGTPAQRVPTRWADLDDAEYVDVDCLCSFNAALATDKTVTTFDDAAVDVVAMMES